MEKAPGNKLDGCGEFSKWRIWIVVLTVEKSIELLPRARQPEHRPQAGHRQAVCTQTFRTLILLTSRRAGDHMFGVIWRVAEAECHQVFSDGHSCHRSQKTKHDCIIGKKNLLQTKFNFKITEKEKCFERSESFNSTAGTEC